MEVPVAGQSDPMAGMREDGGWYRGGTVVVPRRYRGDTVHPWNDIGIRWSTRLDNRHGQTGDRHRRGVEY